MLPSETTRGGLRNLPQESLLSGLRNLLNISLYEHLGTIFRGVHEDTERILPVTGPENTESRDDHKP